MATDSEKVKLQKQSSEVGDQVEYWSKNQWKLGTVKSLNPIKVKGARNYRAKAYKRIRPFAPIKTENKVPKTSPPTSSASKFTEGDKVRCRDDEESKWELGIVTKARPLRVRSYGSFSAETFAYVEKASVDVTQESEAREMDEEQDMGNSGGEFVLTESEFMDELGHTFTEAVDIQSTESPSTTKKTGAVENTVKKVARRTFSPRLQELWDLKNEMNAMLDDDDWTLVTTRQGCEVFSRPVPGEAIGCGRGRATFDVSSHHYAVLKRIPTMDNDTDNNIMGQDVIDEDENFELIHQKIKTPMIVSNRDNLTGRSEFYHAPSETYYFIKKSFDDERVPNPCGKFVRAKITMSMVKIERLTDTSCRVEYIEHIDPGGSIPSVMKNKMATELPMRIVKMYDQIKKTNLTDPGKPTYNEYYWLEEPSDDVMDQEDLSQGPLLLSEDSLAHYVYEPTPYRISMSNLSDKFDIFDDDDDEKKTEEEEENQHDTMSENAKLILETKQTCTDYLEQDAWVNVGSGKNMNCSILDVGTDIPIVRGSGVFPINYKRFAAAIRRIETEKDVEGSRIRSKKIIASLEDDINLIHFEMATPMVISDRDICFIRKEIVDEENNIFYFIERSIEDDRVPVKNKIVRATIVNGMYKIEKMSENQTQIEFVRHIDMGGTLPGFLLKKLQANLPLSIQRTHDWIKKKNWQPESLL